MSWKKTRVLNQKKKQRGPAESVFCVFVWFFCAVYQKKGYRKKSRKSLFLLGRQWFRICFCGPKLQSTTCFCCDSGYVSPGFMVNDLDFCCHNYGFSASTRRPWGPGPSKINTSKRQGPLHSPEASPEAVHSPLEAQLEEVLPPAGLLWWLRFFCFCQCDISWPLPTLFCKLRPIFLWKMFNI